jgi:toxin ParE1/3/4
VTTRRAKRAVFAPAAHEDLLQAWQHLADQSPNTADRWVDAVDPASTRLAGFPALGRARDELVVGVRSFPVGKYLIFYTISPDGVDVLRVLHGARDLDELLQP